MTLRYGSIIQCKVGPEDYKKDPKDQTIAINAGIVDPMNASGPEIMRISRNELFWSTL